MSIVPGLVVLRAILICRRLRLGQPARNRVELLVIIDRAPARSYGTVRVPRVAEVAHLKEVLQPGIQELLRVHPAWPLRVEALEDCRSASSQGVSQAADLPEKKTTFYLLSLGIRCTLSLSVLHSDIDHVLLTFDRLGNNLGVAGVAVRGVGHFRIRVLTRLGVRLIILCKYRVGREARNLLEDLSTDGLNIASLLITRYVSNGPAKGG